MFFLSIFYFYVIFFKKVVSRDLEEQLRKRACLNNPVCRADSPPPPFFPLLPFRPSLPEMNPGESHSLPPPSPAARLPNVAFCSSPARPGVVSEVGISCCPFRPRRLGALAVLGSPLIRPPPFPAPGCQNYPARRRETGGPGGLWGLVGPWKAERGAAEGASIEGAAGVKSLLSLSLSLSLSSPASPSPAGPGSGYTASSAPSATSASARTTS